MAAAAPLTAAPCRRPGAVRPWERRRVRPTARPAVSSGSAPPAAQGRCPPGRVAPPAGTGSGHLRRQRRSDARSGSEDLRVRIGRTRSAPRRSRPRNAAIVAASWTPRPGRPRAAASARRRWGRRRWRWGRCRTNPVQRRGPPGSIPGAGAPGGVRPTSSGRGRSCRPAPTTLRGPSRPAPQRARVAHPAAGRVARRPAVGTSPALPAPPPARRALSASPAGAGSAARPDAIPQRSGRAHRTR